MYTQPFTPPDCFKQDSNTTFLLWNNYKEKVSGLTLTNFGSVAYYDDKVDIKPFVVLRRRLAAGEQSLTNNVDNPLIWNTVLDSRGPSLINLSSFVNTTFPDSPASASIPNYNVFTFPVAGMYDF